MTNNGTIIVTIPRIVPNGGINPNVKKPYENMEERLEEYLTQQRSTGYVPLYKSTDDRAAISNTCTSRVEDIVGRVMAITKKSATVEIIDKDYFMRLIDPAIDIHILTNSTRYTDNSIRVDKIIGICLTNKSEAIK